jgi:hypothetical protein
VHAVTGQGVLGRAVAAAAAGAGGRGHAGHRQDRPTMGGVAR